VSICLHVVDAFPDRPFAGTPAAVCILPAPAIGVNKDPVTGSAHCTRGPLWQSKLGQAGLARNGRPSIWP
jgi:predicted PhzF superfamily epimerase YddE/YHI9